MESPSSVCGRTDFYSQWLENNSGNKAKSPQAQEQKANLVSTPYAVENDL